MGKSRIEYFTFGLIMSLVSVACFAQHSRITQLIAEKQAKMEKLEKCQGTTKKLKIAGISTLGVTAVGVGANIAEAVILKDKESKITTAKEELTKQQEQKEKREAEEKKKQEEKIKQDCENKNAVYDNGVCGDCKNGYTKDENGNCVEKPKQDAQDNGDKQGDKKSGEQIQNTQKNNQNSEAGTGSSNNIATSVSTDEEKLPDWFENACKEALATINGTTCTRVDEPENEEKYQTQVSELNSEKERWKTNGYKFGLCPLNDNTYTCKFSDIKNNKTYTLTVKVSPDKVKCSDGKKFNPTTRKCKNDLSAPYSEPQQVEAPDPSKLNLAPKSGTALTGQGNHNRQQSYCTKIGGTQSGNDCIYNKKIKIEDNFQDSVAQILSEANLTYKGIKPPTSEYVVIAVAPDNKTYLSIKIDKNKVTCKDTTKKLTSDTYRCVGANEDKNALQQAQPKNSVSKEDLITLCVYMHGTAGDNADTNTCRLLAKDAGHMKTLKKHIEENSDAQCTSYSDNEAVICNDKKGKSVTITIRKQFK